MERDRKVGRKLCKSLGYYRDAKTPKFTPLSLPALLRPFDELKDLTPDIQPYLHTPRRLIQLRVELPKLLLGAFFGPLFANPSHYGGITTRILHNALSDHRPCHYDNESQSRQLGKKKSLEDLLMQFVGSGEAASKYNTVQAI